MVKGSGVCLALITLTGCAATPPGVFSTRAIPGLAFGQTVPGSPGFTGFGGMPIGRLDRPSLSSSYWNSGVLGLFMSELQKTSGALSPGVAWGGYGKGNPLGLANPLGGFGSDVWGRQRLATPPQAQPQLQPPAGPGQLRAGEGLLRFLHPIQGPLVPPV